MATPMPVSITTIMLAKRTIAWPPWAVPRLDPFIAVLALGVPVTLDAESWWPCDVKARTGRGHPAVGPLSKSRLVTRKCGRDGAPIDRSRPSAYWCSMGQREANELTARWAAAAGDGRSLVLSGCGVWPLLALLAAAADGPGRTELGRAAGVDAGEGAQAARELLGALADSPSVRLAVGAWVGAGLPLTDWWRAAVPDDVRGELSGDSQADQRRLDAWAHDRTDGLVPRLPVRLDRHTALILVSALAVRTRWRHRFEDTIMPVRDGPWAGRRLAGLGRRSDD